MHDFELQYIEARAQVRAGLEAVRALAEIYMDITRTTMLTYFALHYPNLKVEIVASMRNITNMRGFDYTLDFKFIYPELTREEHYPLTCEVWNYIHTLDIPVIGVMQYTGPDTMQGYYTDQIQG